MTNSFSITNDHLGSWTTVTNERGDVEQRLSFDAWGNPRDPETWSGGYSGTLMFDRGFTGHEHLYGFGLINMNGRMYDPVMSSFLSVDNYVQAPDFSQSFNRYAYCLNNPLKYVDPDGEFWHIVIGAAIGGTVNVLANLKAIDGDFVKGAAYFGIGALAGGLSAGIAGGVGVAYCGESFAAGFLGTTVQAAPSALGFAGGFCVGGSSGLTAGLITGSGNAWMQGAGFGQGLWTGVKTGVLGGLVGGTAYGLVGAMGAGLKGNNWYDGSRDYDINLINRSMPRIQQTTDKNCVGAVVESCSAKDGTGITQEYIRTTMGVKESQGLQDLTAMKTYVEEVGDVKYQISGELDETRGLLVPENSLDNMLNTDTHTWINLNHDNGHVVVLNRVYKPIHVSPRGNMIIGDHWIYEVMDPWRGNYGNVSLSQIQGSQNVLYLKLIR